MMRLGTRILQLVYVIAVLLQTRSATVFSSTAGEGAVRCNKRERQALLTFKQDIFDHADLLSSWGAEEVKKDCCKWRGVRCSNRTGHIIGLDLPGNYDQLGGNISSSLFELRHLIHLDLSQNFFYNYIPESISSLEKLKHLDLSFNELSGPIHNHLGNLTSLEFLNLRVNNFDSVKNLEWLSPLSSLKHLDLTGTNLSQANDWLQVVNNLPHLTNLALVNCELQDPIMPSIPLIHTSTSLALLELSFNNLTASSFQWVVKLNNSLVELDLSNNNLQGLIPETLGYTTSLEQLSLWNNNLEGGVPKSFGSLCRLSSLLLQGNYLEGMLPEIIGNLSGCLQFSLKILRLDYNQITGSLPDLIANFSSLKMFDLSENDLSGNLTQSIGLLSNLEELYIHSNNFSGVITEAHFSKLTKLEKLAFSYNHPSINFSLDWDPPFQLDEIYLESCLLGPEFPKWIKTQRNFSVLDMSFTGISDIIPMWLWNLSSRAVYVDLSSNKIHGTLPDLSDKFQGSLGLNLSSNYLEGLLPSFPANVTYINLSNNKFYGPISSLCSIAGGMLEFLDLSNNQFSGELLDCLNRWPNLVILNLANNHFSGKIPSSIGSLSRLESLKVRENNFSGEIPASLRNCSALQFVDLSYNNFSGMLPYWIGERLTKLNFLLLKSNKFRGAIPLQLCWLKNLQLLDFSCNDLSGSIPRCINNMTALTKRVTSVLLEDHSVTVSYAEGNVEYEIPYGDTTYLTWKTKESEVKDVKMWKAIDFSSNRLTGVIPAQMWSLAGLVQLNLSTNQSTGWQQKLLHCLRKLSMKAGLGN